VTAWIPWATSAGTLLAMWLAGNGDKRAWIVGLLNQGLWFALIFTTDTYGLLPLAIALVVIYARNLIKWKRGALDAQDPGS
jgi:nicotinamide riboside transporter PnuC